MSTILTRKEGRRTTGKHGDRESTSMYLNTRLWQRVKKVAIDLDITATEFVEAALEEELKRVGREVVDKEDRED